MIPQQEIPPLKTRQRFLRYRWVVFSTQTACLAVVFFVWVVPATIGEHLAQVWSLSATSLGVLGSLLFYVYALMQIPSGYLADTWGPRRTVTVAMLIMALGQILFAQATGLHVALLARALTGLGSSVVLIAILKILINWFRANEFATLVGVANLVASVGAILGTAPLALLVLRWGWRLPLLLVGVFTLVLAVLNWLLVRDEPGQFGLPSVSQIDPTMDTVVQKAATREERLSLLKEAGLTWLRTRNVWAVSLLIFFCWGSFQAFQTLWAGPYLAHVHNYSAVAGGMSLLMLSIGSGIGTVASGYLSDKVFRVGRRPFLIGGVVGVGLAWAGILAVMDGANATIINLVFLLLSFSSGFVLIGQTMVKEAVRPVIFGTVFGIVNMFPFLGNGFYQVLMGTLLNFSDAVIIKGSRVYSPESYLLAFMPAFVLGVLCVVLSLIVSEPTKDQFS